ncbi:hypothetical protein ILFOPFJJ_05873 [Ensifer psoraleae]|nr:hypothetical protein [Sinorhizobium psoraleae]
MNLEDLYRLLRNGHIQSQGIIDTVPDPLLVLDQNLCVQSVPAGPSKSLPQQPRPARSAGHSQARP